MGVDLPDFLGGLICLRVLRFCSVLRVLPAV